MNYASLPVQAYNLGHFFLAFALVYVLIPRLLFKPANGSRLDGFVSMYMRMVCFVIVVGYILLITKLYEALGFIGVVAIVFMYRRSRSGKHRNTVGATAMALFYDLVEARYLIVQWFRNLIPKIQERYGEQMRGVRLRLTPSVAELAVFVMIMGVSIYIRGTDALIHPAPSMSDGYVTLSWIKYVDERTLFHDGIYPQGLYFYLATLGKFAFIDLLFVLKYGGDMNTVLIVFGMYYGVHRLTGRRDIGLIAALIYGIYGHSLLGQDWSRQAATNSQEFGFLFVIPTLYFLHRYLDKGDRVDYSTALCGLFVTGLTHPLAYILCVIGCIAVLVAHAVMPGPFSGRRMLVALLGGVASAGMTLAPIALGYAFGKRFNTSSVAFAGATAGPQAAVLPPTLYWTDWFGIAAIVILLIASLHEFIRGKGHREWVIGAVFGALMFSIYYFGGPVTRNVVLISRSLDMWAVVDPFVIALAVHVLVATWNCERMSRFATSGVVTAALCGAAPLGVITPIYPYKMQWPEGVNEYLQINKQFEYDGYMLVANNEEYALVLGNGYRMGIPEFIKMFDPTKPPLTKYGENHPYYGVAPNIFIYYPVQIFEVSKANSIYSIEAPLYAQRAQDRIALEHWLNIYKQHNKLKVYFQDSKLVIYEITATVKKPEKKYHG